MKTILLGLNLLVGAASLLAQGTLQFGNDFTGVFRAPIYGCDPVDPTPRTGQSALGTPTGATVYSGPLLQGTGYTMALFAGSPGTSEPALVMVASTTFRTGTSLPAGLIHTMLVAVPGVPAAYIATLQVRVWDNEGGTVNSWAAVLASPTAARGVSSVFNSEPLGGLFHPALPPNLPPPTTGWTSFNICNVPEPSFCALSSLAAVWLFIRRKPKSQSKQGTG